MPDTRPGTVCSIAMVYKGKFIFFSVGHKKMLINGT
jgi:hypothetical protein